MSSNSDVVQHLHAVVRQYHGGKRVRSMVIVSILLATMTNPFSAGTFAQPSSGGVQDCSKSKDTYACTGKQIEVMNAACQGKQGQAQEDCKINFICSKHGDPKEREDCKSNLRLRSQFSENDPKKYFALGFVALEKGQYYSAILDFKTGLSLDPNSALGHYYVGRAQLGLANDYLAKDNPAFAKDIFKAKREALFHFERAVDLLGPCKERDEAARKIVELQHADR